MRYRRNTVLLNRVLGCDIGVVTWQDNRVLEDHDASIFRRNLDLRESLTQRISFRTWFKTLCITGTSGTWGRSECSGRTSFMLPMLVIK
jgi:hypothetical protein